MNKVLLIEDEDFIREVYRDELEASNFSVDAFPTGQQGLDAFYKSNYDIVLLDIVLPDISGLHILKKIKNDEAKKHIPVLLLSNLDQDIIVRQGLEFGAEAYLEKVDNTPDKIIEIIKTTLNTIKSRQSKQS